MDINILQEIEKIKYHNKILLNIAVSEDKEETLFFQSIIDYDLSEFQVKSIVNIFKYLSYKEDINLNSGFIE